MTTELTDPHRTETAHATVAKQIRQPDEGVAHVVFTLESTADAPVRVTLTEALPESITDGRVGTHPEHGGDNWRVTEEQTLVYETDLDPGAAETTLYGVDAPGDAIDDLAGAPTVDVTPLAAASSTIEQGDVLGDGGQYGDASPDADDPFAGVPDPSDGRDGVAESGPAMAGAPAGGTGSSDAATSTGGDQTVGATPEAADASVLDALLAELRSTDLDADDRQLLRDHLGVEQAASSPDRSLEARVRHVQSTVDDLEAYRDALEAFVDDNGFADEVIADFESALDDLEATVEDLSTTLTDLDERVDRVESDVTDLDERVTGALADQTAALDRLEASVDDRLAEVDEDVDALRAEVEADVAELRTAVDDELDAVRADVEEGKRWRERLSQAVGLEAAAPEE